MALCQGKDLDKDHMRGLLMDTVVLLCKNGITFKRNIRVQGLLGITIDDDDIFLVQINENVENESSIARSEAGVFSAVKLNSYATSSANNSFIEKSSSAKRKNGKGSIDINSQICASTLSACVAGTESSTREMTTCKKRKMSDQNEFNMKSNHERDTNSDQCETSCSEANVEVVQSLPGTTLNVESLSGEMEPVCEARAILCKKVEPVSMKLEPTYGEMDTVQSVQELLGWEVDQVESTSGELEPVYGASDGTNPADFMADEVKNDDKEWNDSKMSRASADADVSGGEEEDDDDETLQESLLIKEDDQRKSFKCLTCNKRFSRASNCNAHYRSVHSIDKPYSCEQCDYSCARLTHLTQHNRTAHNIVKDFPCTECVQIFPNKRGLMRHIKSVHNTERLSKCSDCEKTFLRPDHLKRHIDAVHAGLKPYTCNECGRNFSTKSHLLGHTNSVHSKHKYYTCTHCNKKFLRTDVLRRHVRTLHSDSFLLPENTVTF